MHERREVQKEDYLPTWEESPIGQEEGRQKGKKKMDQFSEQSEMSVRHTCSSIIGTDHDTMRCKSRVKKRKIWRQLASHGVSLECYSSLEDHDGGRRLTGMLSRKRGRKRTSWATDDFLTFALELSPLGTKAVQNVLKSVLTEPDANPGMYFVSFFFLSFFFKEQVLSFSSQCPYTTFCMRYNGN